MLKLSSVLCALIVCVQTLLSQTPETFWTRTYGGSMSDAAASAIFTLDNGIIAVGNTSSFGAGNGDIWLIKTDSSGDTVWTRTFGSIYSDKGAAVLQTSDSGFVIAGTAYDSLYNCGILIKTDSHGDTVWTKTYGDGTHHYIYAAEEIQGSGFVLAGQKNSKAWVLKTDSQGDTVWSYSHSGMESILRSIMKTNDNGFIATGRIMTWTGTEALIIKIDSQGDTSWTRSFGGLEFGDCGNSVIQTMDNGYLIAGDSYTGGWGDVWLIKTDSLGELLWTKKYGGSNHDEAKAVQQCPDGGFIICGSTKSYGLGESDIWIIRTDSSGDTLWTKVYGGTGFDAGLSVEVGSNDRYVVAGYEDDDVFLLKLKDNYLPSVLSFTPMNDTMNILEGESVQLSISAFDNNNDSLKYSWYLNDDSVSSDTTYLFTSNYMSEGSYRFQVNVSDEFSDTSIYWVVNVENYIPDSLKPVIQDSISLTQTDGNEVVLVWAQAQTSFGVYRYRIFRDSLEIGAAQSEYYADNSAAGGETYLYEVSVIDSANNESERISRNITIDPIWVKYSTHAFNGIDNPNNVGNMVGIGRQVMINVSLTNAGSQNALSVKVDLRSSDDYIAIIDSLGSYNNIGVAETVACYVPFSFMVNDSCPAGRSAKFILEISDSWGSSWTDSFDVLIEPLVIDRFVIDDDNIPDSDGNSNGVPEDGETIEITPRLKNVASIDITNVSGELISLNDHAVVDTNSNVWSYGDISLGAQAFPEFDYVFTMNAGSDTSNIAIFLKVTGDISHGSYSERRSWLLPIIGDEPTTVVDYCNARSVKGNFLNPNPVIGNTLTIRFNSPLSKQMQIFLMDVNGNRIDNEIVSEGSREFSWDLSVTPGAYYIKVGNHTVKSIIVK